jgi:hypothetical protein
MKVKSWIKMVILAAALTALTARSQVIITNFSSPTPTWRTIDGQIYDLLSLPTIKVPTELSYVTFGYNGVPKQPIVLQGFLQGNPSTSVTFLNFPFDPKDFSPVHGMTGLQLGGSLYCRALKTSEVTNWNVLGQPTSVDTVYDCGASVTNSIIVIPFNPGD